MSMCGKQLTPPLLRAVFLHSKERNGRGSHRGTGARPAGVAALLALAVLLAPALPGLHGAAAAPDAGPAVAPLLPAAVACPPAESQPAAPGTEERGQQPAAALRWSVSGLPDIAAMSGAITEALRANAVAFPGQRGTVSGFLPGPIYHEIYSRDAASAQRMAPYLYGDAFLRASTEEYLYRQWTGPRGPFTPGQPPFPGADALDGQISPTGTTDKSTSTSDEEPSVVHSAAAYARQVGGAAWLACPINGRTVLDRLDGALRHLVTARRDPATGLIMRAHTTDWGDVRAFGGDRPTHHDPVNEQWTASIYDQAVVYQAMREMTDLHRMAGAGPAAADWEARAAELRERSNRFLWQPVRGFYRPHLHLTPARHPFDEDSMVSIANAVAVTSGLAGAEQAGRIFRALEIARTAAAVAKPGLAIYPPYPWAVWGHPLMGEWDYQNGGQWDWWGAHQILGEFATGHSELATTHLAAVAKEWQTHPNNIYEWQNPFGRPFHGSAYYAAAGGTMGDAVVRGLFGVEFTLKRFQLGPRLGARDGAVELTQPAAGYAVTLRQQMKGGTLTVDYTVRHPGAGDMTVLLPEGQTAVNVLVDGQPWPFRVFRQGDDLLVDLEDLDAGTHQVSMPLRPQETPPLGVRWNIEGVRQVAPAGAAAPALAVVENAGAQPWRAGETPLRLQARWLDAAGRDLPDSAVLTTAVPAPRALQPGEAAPLKASLRTPSAPGEYRLRWEALGPDGALLPGAAQEAPFRVAGRPWNAVWVGGVAEGVIAAGSGTVEVPVAVENAGTEWWRAAGANPVALAPRWLHEDGSPAPEITAAPAPLPADVAPGASVRLIARLMPPAQPGRYRLVWDLQRRPDGPFSQTGSATFTTLMTVAPVQ